MQLEFHHLDRRWEHLRVCEPHRQRRLLASLAESGQQKPIVVVAAGPPDRYLVIDGHKSNGHLMFLFGEALPPEHHPEATQKRAEQEYAGGFRNGVLDDGNIIQRPVLRILPV